MPRFPERAKLDPETARRVDAAADAAARNGSLESIAAIVQQLGDFSGLARLALLRTLLREHFEVIQNAGGRLPTVGEYLQAFADDSERAIVREIFAEQLPALHVELGREIGRGGMGVIYEARQTTVGGRRVAVKMLDIGAGNQAFLWNRLREEVDVLAQIQSSNVVRVFEVGLIDGQLGFVMELAEQNLEQRTGGHPQDPRHAAQVVAKLAVAVQAAHDHPKRLIHQDLKPSNVLVFDGPEHKIADFGLFRSADEGRTADRQRVLGTPGWLAPEQARGEPATFATDVWGLGAILYFLLTGSAPFPSERERIQEVSSGLLLPPGQRRRAAGGDALDPRLEAIVLKCLSRDPAQRYRRPIEIAEELQRYLNAQPVLARLPSHTRRRRTVRVALAAVVALALIAAALPVLRTWQKWTEGVPPHSLGTESASRVEPPPQSEVTPDDAGKLDDAVQAPASGPDIAVDDPKSESPEAPDTIPGGGTVSNRGDPTNEQTNSSPGGKSVTSDDQADFARWPAVFSREFSTGGGGLPANVEFQFAPTSDLLNSASSELKARITADPDARVVEAWTFELRPGDRGSQQELHFTRTLKVRLRENGNTSEQTFDVRSGFCTREMSERYFKAGAQRFVCEPKRNSAGGLQQFRDVGRGTLVTGRFNWKGATRNHYEVAVDDERWIIWSLVPRN